MVVRRVLVVGCNLVVALSAVAVGAQPLRDTHVRGRLIVGATVVSPCRIEPVGNGQHPMPSAAVSCPQAQRPEVRLVEPETLVQQGQNTDPDTELRRGNQSVLEVNF